MKGDKTMNPIKVYRWLFIVLFGLISLAPAQEANQKKSEQTQIILQVEGLSCPFCAYGLEKKLKAIDGVKKTDIKLNTGIVKLYVRPNVEIDSLTLKKKIDEAGFTLKKFNRKQMNIKNKTNKKNH